MSDANWLLATGLATICKFREERPQRSELSAGSSDRGFGPSGQFRWAKRAGPALFLHGRGSNLAGGDLLGTRFSLVSIDPNKDHRIDSPLPDFGRAVSPRSQRVTLCDSIRCDPIPALQPPCSDGHKRGWRFFPRENEKRATRCSAPVQAGPGLPRGNSQRGQGSQRAFPSRLRQPAGLTAMQPASSFVSTLICNCPGVVVSRIHMAQPGGSYAVTNPFHPARPQLQRALNQPSTGKTLRPSAQRPRLSAAVFSKHGRDAGAVARRRPAQTRPIFRPNPPISADANWLHREEDCHDECHRRHPGLHSR